MKFRLKAEHVGKAIYMGKCKPEDSALFEPDPEGIEPMHDRVLVERLPEPGYSGLIYIPEAHRKPAILCKVIAVGPGRWEDGVFTKTAVKPGDTVLVPHADRWLEKNADWKAGQQVIIQSGDIGAIVG